MIELAPGSAVVSQRLHLEAGRVLALAGTEVGYRQIPDCHVPACAVRRDPNVLAARNLTRKRIGHDRHGLQRSGSVD